MMGFQRFTQSLSLTAYIIGLGLAAFPLVSPVTVAVFIGLDPVVVIGTSLSGRQWIPALWAGVLILAGTPLIGRFFCSTLCPMGTTIDVTDRWLGAYHRPTQNHPRRQQIKYYLLFFILGAALLGVSFVFLAAPLSLITRFYGLILHPALCHGANIVLDLLRPLFEWLDIPRIAYHSFAAPRHGFQWVTVLIFAGIFAAARLSPRFWCRYLCPAGAALALLSRAPLIRRQVSERCTDCGICIEKCPMDAIGKDPHNTRHEECIACETCVRVCPTGAITFRASFSGNSASKQFSPVRRQIVRATLAGAGAAAITRGTAAYPTGKSGPGQLTPPRLIRPPGAVPEIDFLAKCIRCGACMKACPTNTLQPLGLSAGFAAFFSPMVLPRRGPCEPGCNICGRVCPTGAIREISEKEKIWAKIGTAHILRHRCLAWEFDRNCLVCDEVCPYNAITLKQVDTLRIAVPFIDETRCSGCGFCEYHCPVQPQSAIQVSPMAAFRINDGSYKKFGIRQGVSLKLKTGKPEMPTDFDGLPPGFTN